MLICASPVAEELEIDVALQTAKNTKDGPD